MLYSVPYEYIKRKVDVRVTDTIIEIFYNYCKQPLSADSRAAFPGQSGPY